jgi:translation initiation factor 3 subunit L
MAETVEFTLPGQIRDFVFDLHESTRMSMRQDDVAHYYEVRFKELTEKYFNKSTWPSAQSVAPECNGDEAFLAFYKEMTVRHLFTKLNPQLSDFLDSWSNYNKVCN